MCGIYGSSTYYMHASLIKISPNVHPPLVSTHSPSSPSSSFPPAAGGALADPVDMGILVFTDKAVAEAFAAKDAYVKAGLVREWKVRQWTVVAGSKL